MINLVDESSEKETGGILVGRYSTSLRNVYINELSAAPIDSKSGFCWFIRGVTGLKEYLKRKWEKSDEYYLGEWHFHPENVPEPSSTDIIQLKKIAVDKNFNCREPILMIISKNRVQYNLSMNLLIDTHIYMFYEHTDYADGIVDADTYRY